MTAGTVSISVPSDCTLVLVNCYYTGVAPTSNPTFQLNATDDFTRVYQYNQGSPGYENQLVEYLVDPDTGTQDLDWSGLPNAYGGMLIVVSFWKGVDTTDPIGAEASGNNTQSVTVSSCGTDDVLVGMYSSFNKNLNITPAGQNQTAIKEDLYGAPRYNYIGVAYEQNDTIFYATGTTDGSVNLYAFVLNAEDTGPTAVEKIGTAATYYQPTYDSDDEQGSRSLVVPTDCDCIVATYVCNWPDTYGSKWYDWSPPFFKLGTTPFQKIVSVMNPDVNYDQVVIIEVLTAPATGSQTLYWDTTALETVNPTEGVVIIWDYYKNVDPDDPVVDFDVGIEAGVDITGMTYSTGDMMVGVAMNTGASSPTITDNGQTQVWKVQAEDVNRDNWGGLAIKASSGDFYITDVTGHGATAAIVLRFFVADAFLYAGADLGEIGFADAQAGEAEVGMTSTIGFTETMDNDLELAGQIFEGIGFNVVTDGVNASVWNSAMGIGFTEIAEAFNLSAYLRQYAETLVITYEATLTGAADGLSDYLIPRFRSIQIRLRQGDPSYLGVVLVYSSDALGEIQSRSNGTLVVDMIGKADGAEILREPLMIADLENIRYDRGVESQSITLVGYRTQTFTGGAEPIALPAVMTESMSNEGLMRFRCALPDFYLKPGYLASYDIHEITVGSIVYNIAGDGQVYMDVSE